MTTPRRIALIAGALYLVTFATSIPALALKAPVLNDPSVLADGASSGPLLWAGILEIILAVACVGTAVVLYPIARRQSAAAALGFVASRTIEGALILLGVIAMLSLSSLPREALGASAEGLAPVESALVALHDWAFLIGPGLIPAINALCLGYVLYRSRLVPRIIPIVGLIGAPLLIASVVATMFGAIDQVSPIAAVLALPIALWEFSIGVWMLVKGFTTSSVEVLERVPDAAISR